MLWPACCEAFNVRRNAILHFSYYRSDDREHWDLRGRLAGSWAEELRTVWRRIRQHVPCAHAVIDLKDVTSIDEAGEQVSAPSPPQPEEEVDKPITLEFLKSLMLQGVLTRFQTDWLLEGKFKEFTIDVYRIVDILGTGGMGWLYVGANQETGEKAAVKVISRHMENDYLTRFKLEARAGLLLNHPNIVSTIKLGETALIAERRAAGPRVRLSDRGRFGRMLGESPAMRRLYPVL